mgnify:CR=1 FL=1
MFTIDVIDLRLQEQIEEAKERTKEDIEKELYYITEENRQLRKKVREGQAAEEKLSKNERRVMELMTCCLGMKREER